LESNVLAVAVDAGPANTGYNVNRLYATVKVCMPGSTECRTIDHVLVDTGSTGLRLLSSAISPALNLNRVTTGVIGLPLLNCAQFVDNSFAWGPVATADIVLGGKTAASVPIQIIGDPAFNSLAAACSSGGTAITTAATLGANGIVGLGLFKEDCGSGCAVIPANGFYYTCADFTCTTAVPTTASITKQVANPVSLFATDNNGVLIDLPAVTTGTAPSLSGSLIFGMGTQANNQLVPSAVLTTSSSGYINTLLAGQTMNNSFIDTGSNGLFFDLNSIPICSGASTGFYCPVSRINLLATLVGTNSVAVPVSFDVDNALTLFSTGHAVLPTLAGDIGYAQTFDWGLPFFYGRRVFIGIEGQPSSLGTGPLYAF
jgi:predicted aspartyl protease